MVAVSPDNQELITDNLFLYCGEQFDPDLGLYFLRARYMDTDRGRFWSMDVFQGVHEIPMSLHKYLYGGGNPVTHTDPTGRFTITSLVAAAHLIGELATIASPSVRGTKTVRMAILGAHLSGFAVFPDGRGVIDQHNGTRVKSFTSSTSMSSLEDHVISEFDSDGNGMLDYRDGAIFDLRITGYSWGATTAVQLADRLSSSTRIARKGAVLVKTGSVDPVRFLRRAPEEGWDVVPGHAHGKNIYQTVGVQVGPFSDPIINRIYRGMRIGNLFNEEVTDPAYADHLRILDYPNVRQMVQKTFL